jgi:hypothetical protein
VHRQVVAAAKDEKAQKLCAHGSRRIVPHRAQAVADSTKVSRPKTRGQLGFGGAERLEIGEAANDGTARSSFRNVLAQLL